MFLSLHDLDNTLYIYVTRQPISEPIREDSLERIQKGTSFDAWKLHTRDLGWTSEKLSNVTVSHLNVKVTPKYWLLIKHDRDPGIHAMFTGCLVYADNITLIFLTVAGTYPENDRYRLKGPVKAKSSSLVHRKQKILVDFQ